MQAFLLRRIEHLGAVAGPVAGGERLPHFISAYYQKLLKVSTKWLLFENSSCCWHSCRGICPVPDEAGQFGVGRRWRIGRFGYLDDERSWHIPRRGSRASCQARC